MQHRTTDETIVLGIEAECSNAVLRDKIEKRFRLRGRIRKAIAEGMGTEDYGVIQVDSQSFEIDKNNSNIIICKITLSVHHFSTDVEINMQSAERGYSKPVTKLIQSCNDGTLASVKSCTQYTTLYTVHCTLYIHLDPLHICLKLRLHKYIHTLY